MPTDLEIGRECSAFAARLRAAQSGWRSRMFRGTHDSEKAAGLNAAATIVTTALASMAADLGVPLREAYGIEEWTPPPPPRVHTFDGEVCSQCGCLRDGAIARLTCGTVQNIAKEAANHA